MKEMHVPVYQVSRCAICTNRKTAYKLTDTPTRLTTPLNDYYQLL